MTEKHFYSRFHGVISPDFRGAPHPPYDIYSINESEIPDELRYKEWSLKFDEGNEDIYDEITLDWTSQEWCESTEILFNEVKRCFRACGFAGNVSLHVHDRDGEHECSYEEII